MNPTQLHVIKFFYCAALVWGWVWRVISLDSFIKEKQKKKKKKKRPIQEIKEKKQTMNSCNFNSGPSIAWLESYLSLSSLTELSRSWRHNSVHDWHSVVSRKALHLYSLGLHTFLWYYSPYWIRTSVTKWRQWFFVKWYFGRAIRIPFLRGKWNDFKSL